MDVRRLGNACCSKDYSSLYRFRTPSGSEGSDPPSPLTPINPRGRRTLELPTKAAFTAATCFVKEKTLLPLTRPVVRMHFKICATRVFVFTSAQGLGLSKRRHPHLTSTDLLHPHAPGGAYWACSLSCCAAPFAHETVVRAEGTSYVGFFRWCSG